MKIHTQSNKEYVKRESRGKERKCIEWWKTTCLVNWVSLPNQRSSSTYLLPRRLANHRLELTNLSYSYQVPLSDDLFYFISSHETRQFTIPILPTLFNINHQLYPLKNPLILLKQQVMITRENLWISQSAEFRKSLRWRQPSKRRRDRRNSKCIQKYYSNRSLRKRSVRMLKEGCNFKKSSS